MKFKNIALLSTLILLIFGGVIFTAIFFKVPLSSTGGGTGTGGNPGTPGQSAWCQQAGALISLSQATSSGTGPGCYNLPMTLDLFLKDRYTGAALTTWKCDIISAGGTYNIAASGSVLEGGITSDATKGDCKSSGTYVPTQALFIRACDTTCSTAYGSAVHTVYELVLPSTSGSSAGAGVVGFASTSSQTALTITTSIQQVGSATGYASFTPAWTFVYTNSVNQTAFTTSATIFVKSGTKALCSVAPCKPILTFTLSETGTATTNPWGAGYSSFPQYEIAAQTLQAEFVAQEKTSDATPAMCATIPGGSPPILFTNSQTNVYYGNQIPDGSTVRSVTSGGSPVSNGQYTTTITFDCTPLFNGSANTDTFVVTPYIYFNLPYFSGSGAVNSEAVALATAFTLTLKT
jgi:hypothetical protein